MTEHAMNPEEPLKENTQGMLRIFVYGTLKRGFWNHDRFCRGVLDVREAEVRGRLYEMHSAIPVLQVPDWDVLAHGTSDVWTDVATQARLSEQLASYPEPALQSATAGDWGRVYGELLTFDDPETRLPAIDRLEGFHPGGPSLYRRVLVPVCITGMAQPAWLYTGDSCLQPDLRLIPSGTWGRATP
ncbi:AIG2 family protein [Desulfosarcina cetonica]|uniref:gamma-glutamylcyclotransferase family protein n=1 Tax=Desulfosarcina cetonica TaxID=90730 RepID=UPI000B28685B|nr:gamma-glutamylcyclotransferase family protein [Desulfosarcina cetonica]VTR66853.1 AIG2 family protein [Desulfosarcina cetonica]